MRCIGQSLIMSLSCSGCFSDLLCCEDAGILVEELPEYSPDLEFPSDIEELISECIEEEGEYMPGFDYRSKFQSQSLDASARKDSIAWILKVQRIPIPVLRGNIKRTLDESYVHLLTYAYVDKGLTAHVQAFYGFRPLTAYLSVNYMDRFLASRHLPKSNGWPLQLLSVACLSLAAKMEEAIVPSLLDLQVENTKFIFDPRTIQRMELLVLGVLDWRLRSITPFTFIDFFAFKLDSTGAFIGFLVSRATQIILDIVRDVTFLDYWPSSVAAAAILCAANEIPNLSFKNPGINAVASWCLGLSKDRILSCYKLMKEVVMIIDAQNIKRKPPKVLQQLRVTTTYWAKMISSSSSSCESSPSSSSSILPSNNKRRKLNKSISLWVDDDETSDDHKDKST